ncbi:MAG: hypothetical protein WCJ19_04825 [bacterium]
MSINLGRFLGPRGDNKPTSEVIQNKMLETYDPNKHTELAAKIEPLLKNLTTAQSELMSADDRRKLIGVLSVNGVDHVFIDFGEIPLESPSTFYPDLKLRTIKEAYGNRGVGIYDTEGILFVRSKDGRNWVGGETDIPDPNLSIDPNSVYKALEYKGFKFGGKGNIGSPFSSSDGNDVYAAALNGVVPGLARNIIQKRLLDIDVLCFYTTSDGETVAGVPPSPELPDDSDGGRRGLLEPRNQ